MQMDDTINNKDEFSYFNSHIITREILINKYYYLLDEVVNKINLQPLNKKLLKDFGVFELKRFIDNYKKDFGMYEEYLKDCLEKLFNDSNLELIMKNAEVLKRNLIYIDQNKIAYQFFELLKDIIKKEESPFLTQENFLKLKKLYFSFSTEEQEIIKEFYLDKKTIFQIATSYKMSKELVLIIISNCIVQISELLNQYNIQKYERPKKVSRTNIIRYANIYEYFKDYSEDEVDRVLLLLDDEERRIIKLRDFMKLYFQKWTIY